MTAVAAVPVPTARAKPRCGRPLLAALLFGFCLLAWGRGPAMAQAGTAPSTAQTPGTDLTSAGAGWFADAADDLTNALRPIFASAGELPDQLRLVVERIAETSGGSLRRGC